MDVDPYALKRNEVANLIKRTARYHKELYRSLSAIGTFGRGWLRQNDETRKQALAMG